MTKSYINSRLHESCRDLDTGLVVSLVIGLATGCDSAFIKTMILKSMVNFVIATNSKVEAWHQTGMTLEPKHGDMVKFNPLTEYTETASFSVSTILLHILKEFYNEETENLGSTGPLRIKREIATNPLYEEYYGWLISDSDYALL